MDASPRREPVADLRMIAFLLERALESSYRVKAFRGAANTLAKLDAGEIDRRAADGTLKELEGVGDRTAAVVVESVAGDEPAYLRTLVEAAEAPPESSDALRAALKGDLHTHSDWSDGGSPILEMAQTGRALGHAYMVLTDHSPRLTVANGLKPDRLRRQIDVVAEVNDKLKPFRLLTGIECDINEDGSLDQEPELLDRLDVVVASVHSKLRMPSGPMTRRMLAAIENPHTDVLGHCTGRMLKRRERGGQPRPPSEFDAAKVFAACAEHGVAVEINSRPERLDPPMKLLQQAVKAGCLFSIDTDAHAPGQLDWLFKGCERAQEAGVTPDRVVNTWPEADLLAWTADHTHRPATTSGRRATASRRARGA